MFNSIRLGHQKTLKNWCKSYKDTVSIESGPNLNTWIMNQYKVRFTEPKSLLHFIEEFGGRIHVEDAKVISVYEEGERASCDMILEFSFLKQNKKSYPSTYIIEDVAHQALQGNINAQLDHVRTDYLNDDRRFILTQTGEELMLSLRPTSAYKDRDHVFGQFGGEDYQFHDPKYYRLVLIHLIRKKHAEMQFKIIRREDSERNEVLKKLHEKLTPKTLND